LWSVVKRTGTHGTYLVVCCKAYRYSWWSVVKRTGTHGTYLVVCCKAYRYSWWSVVKRTGTHGTYFLISPAEYSTVRGFASGEEWVNPVAPFHYQTSWNVYMLG